MLRNMFRQLNVPLNILFKNSLNVSLSVSLSDPGLVHLGKLVHFTRPHEFNLVSHKRNKNLA